MEKFKPGQRVMTKQVTPGSLKTKHRFAAAGLQGTVSSDGKKVFFDNGEWCWMNTALYNDWLTTADESYALKLLRELHTLRGDYDLYHFWRDDLLNGQAEAVQIEDDTEKRHEEQYESIQWMQSITTFASEVYALSSPLHAINRIDDDLFFGSNGEICHIYTGKIQPPEYIDANPHHKATITQWLADDGWQEVIAIEERITYTGAPLMVFSSDDSETKVCIDARFWGKAISISRSEYMAVYVRQDIEPMVKVKIDDRHTALIADALIGKTLPNTPRARQLARYWQLLVSAENTAQVRRLKKAVRGKMEALPQ